MRDAEHWSDPKVRGWSAVHSDDVLKSLRRDAISALGELPIGDIDTPTVLELLQKIEQRGAIESAHRLRQRMSGIFTFAIAAGIARNDPTPKSLLKVLRGDGTLSTFEFTGYRGLAFAINEPSGQATVNAQCSNDQSSWTNCSILIGSNYT